MLFVTRMGVGVGEAALVPAAVSLLADSFAPARRALPLAIFTAGVSVGAGLALMLGSALIAVAQAGLGGWFEDRAVWQIVLVLAGALGIPVAFAILMLRDPAPVGRVEPAAGNGLLPYLRAYPRLFALMLGGSSLLYVLSYSVSAWMPTLFVREFGWTPQVVGLRMGLVILAVALIGNIGSGLIANRLTLAGRPHGALLTMTTGAFLLIPAALLAPLAPSAGFAQAGLAGIYLAIALCFGVATASFVAVTPPRLRGRMAAIYLSLGNLIGMGIGPPLTGLILQEVLGSAEQVGIALALVTVPTAIAGALLLRSALALHRRRAAELLA
jgi:MFS family permease